MSEANHQLYILLSACAGNWRNAVYISDTPGYLFSADRDGHPIVMTVEQFQQLTGEQIDPTECCGQLTSEGFKALYSQYLLWYMPSAEDDPVSHLSRTVSGQEEFGIDISPANCFPCPATPPAYSPRIS